MSIKPTPRLSIRFWLSSGFIALTVILVAACGRGSHGNSLNLGDKSTSEPEATEKSTKIGNIKIGVNREGLYEISRDDIVKLEPDWAKVDPASFTLSLRGQSQSIWIRKQSGKLSLIFYGQPSTSRYTDRNVYLLTVDGGAANLMEEEQLQTTRNNAAESFLSTLHFEENLLYSPLVESGDHLFWFSLPGGKEQIENFDLPGLATGTGNLQVEIWGSTESSSEYDHHLVITLNDHPLINEKWDGTGRRNLETEVPAGLLKAKGNVLIISAPGDTGAAAEVNYLDWFDVKYPRLAQAQDDSLAFNITTAMPETTLHLTNFSSPVHIFDVTTPTETVVLTDTSKEKSLLYTGETKHRYIAVGPSGFLKPVDLARAVLTPDLRAPDSGADYVAIGPQDLLQPLTPLLDWRKSQGLKVISVPVEAIYDQFTGGFPEPEAIQVFMTYASKSWHPAPRYLLLVGDATYDPRGYISTPEANRLPVVFVVTRYGGETASDVILGDVNGDRKPDLAVGRIPAQTAEQVKALVNKILTYEQFAAPEAWRYRVLAIADGQDASFRKDAQSFLDQVQRPYTGLIYTPEAGVRDAQLKVKDYFNEGFGLIAYFGHGSINMWGKDRIFMAEDVNNLANITQLPVVINMTCLTGLFIHPKVISMMETLLWFNNGGAVAVLAPTSLTLASSQSVLSQAFIDTWMQRSEETLGDIFLKSQQMVPGNNEDAQEVLLTFLLFGDPALRVYPK